MKPERGKDRDRNRDKRRRESVCTCTCAKKRERRVSTLYAVLADTRDEKENYMI
jgi:hypothetical protein